jgi:hypothetical protein
MKNKAIKSVFVALLVMLFSCDEPETIVTNTVHPDGSVTRHIEMRSMKNNFTPSVLQVPFDSTWIINDTIIIGEKRDTTWIKTAEKLFKNVDEINQSYRTDKGVNKDAPRSASFIKKFRWFNTVYRYSESVDKKMLYGYPVRDFLNKDELTYFYSPGSMKSEMQNGPDSLKYRALEDTINKITDKWTEKSLVSEWIGEFSRLTAGKGNNDISKESLKLREDDFVKIIHKYEGDNFDSIWAKGTILKEMIGEKNAEKYKTEADTSIAIITRIIVADFKEYSVKIIMPGKVVGTNGFIDKTDHLLWPVKSDYYLTEKYEMWAESKMVNRWAWIITGVFILFVITGLILRLFRKP